MKSLLPNPGSGVALGLGEAIAVYLVYQNALPSHADMRAGPANDENLEAARKGAALKCAGLLGVIFLLTHDVNSFIVGGLALGGVDYLAKHHNAINMGGKWDTLQGGQTASPSNVYSLPDYNQSEAM